MCKGLFYVFNLPTTNLHSLLLSTIAVCQWSLPCGHIMHAISTWHCCIWSECGFWGEMDYFGVTPWLPITSQRTPSVHEYYLLSRDKQMANMASHFPEIQVEMNMVLSNKMTSTFMYLVHVRCTGDSRSIGEQNYGIPPVTLSSGGEKSVQDGCLYSFIVSLTLTPVIQVLIHRLYALGQ